MLDFMKQMIKRTWPSRIYEIDEVGSLWIVARLDNKGSYEYHYRDITESAGWCLVKPRNPPQQP